MWTASARHQYRRSAARYATDVTDAEFALVEPLLPAAKRGGRQRTTLLREVLNALLYLLRTGCPWRMLPREFPPRSTVYGYFRRFWEEGIVRDRHQLVPRQAIQHHDRHVAHQVGPGASPQ